MGKARNLADLLDDNGDVKSASLDNVPASNNASALTTGTLPIARIADGTVTAAKVAADVATQAELDAAGVGGATGVDFNDNVAVRLGSSGDLKFIHDGSNSYIEDTGTGALRVLSSYFNVRNPADNESMITATENGAVELFHNDSKKIETTATGVTVTGATNSTVMPTFGGVAIVAKGSNSNGSYTKWADGTMICEATKSTSQQNTGPSAGGYYHSNSGTWTYPVAFNATPRIVTNTRGGHWNAISAKTHNEGSTSCSFNTLSINSTGNSQDVSLLAYGTWS